MNLNLAVISGDGIGPEVVREARKVLDRIAEKYGHEIHYTDLLMGGASIDVHGVPLTDEGHRDEVVALLSTLAEADWADLRDVWAVMAGGCRQHALTILIRKIAEIENGRTKEES